jgi:eosinophil peroxidase/sodium/potassium/calcium exchanger 1
MDLEMQILIGYINNYIGKLDESKDYYKKSLENSLICENERYKAISLCNIGIIEADKDIDNFLVSLGDPELAEKLNFDYDYNNELLIGNQETEQKKKEFIENLEQQEDIENGEQVNENNGEEYEGEPDEEGEQIQHDEEYEGNEGEMEGNEGEMEGNEGEMEGEYGEPEGGAEGEEYGPGEGEVDADDIEN